RDHVEHGEKCERHGPILALEWSDDQSRFRSMKWTIMRRSRGALLPPVAARRRRDLYRALRGALLDGTLGPGERLPSSRQAAGDWGVSRGLVEEVYGQLTVEGFLERGVGQGTFVSAPAARPAPPPPPGRPSPRRPRPA